MSTIFEKMYYFHKILYTINQNFNTIPTISNALHENTAKIISNSGCAYNRAIMSSSDTRGLKLYTSNTNEHVKEKGRGKAIAWMDRSYPMNGRSGMAVTYLRAHGNLPFHADPLNVDDRSRWYCLVVSCCMLYGL